MSRWPSPTANRTLLLAAAGLLLSSWNLTLPTAEAGLAARAAEAAFSAWLQRERQRLLAGTAATGALPPAPTATAPVPVVMGLIPPATAAPALPATEPAPPDPRSMAGEENAATPAADAPVLAGLLQPLTPPAATIPRLTPSALPLPPPERRPGAVVRAPETTPSPTPVAAPATTGAPAGLPEAVREAAAVAPAAGPPLPTPRRDPLDLPLEERQRWEEWLLAVTVNGERVSEGAYVVRDPASGRLAVRVEDMRGWRLKVDRARILTFQGMPFYPLDAIPDVQVRFDERRLELAIEAPPQAFEPFRLDVRRIRRLEPTIAPGAFLDYDLSFTAGDGVEERADALVELGAFGAFGVVRSGFVLRDLLEGPRLERLETSFVRDFPERRTSLRLGDALTAGGSFTAPVRFAGIQYGTDFSLDPTFVAFPLPAIGGLARQRSVVEVLVDNVRQATGEVPPGPFEISNIPVVTGAGEVQLKVRDLLGRERLITQRYYLSPRLLRPGLADWSLAAGVLRRGYGERSFDYGDPFAAGLIRYGLTDDLTVEAYGALRRGRALAILGGSLRLERFGLISGAIGLSQDADDGPGGLVDLAYEYLSAPFDLTLGFRRRLGDFRTLAQGRPEEGREEVRLGFDLGRAGRLGLGLVRRQPPRGATTVAATASWSLPLGEGSLLLNAARLFEPESELAIGLAWSMPLGGQRSVAAEARFTDGDRRLRAQIRQGRGASDLGLDWRLAAEVGERPRYLDGRLAYQGRYGRIALQGELDDGDPRMRLNLDGSLALVAGTLRASRRIGRAFGLVALPGLPGVRVYLDNREVGRTDADGLLLIPGLRPYETNRISLELDDLPLGVSVERRTVEVAPYRGAAVVVDFGLRAEGEATARLVDGAGPLPAGLVLRQGATVALVGRDGFAHIRGLPRSPLTLEGASGNTRWRCPLPPPPTDGDDPLPDLGEIRCDRADG